MLDKDTIRKIVTKQIKQDHDLGERAGSSGHLSDVSFHIENISEPQAISDTDTRVTYSYTITIVSEFTIYPDNPPLETTYEKTIDIDKEGNIIKESDSKVTQSNFEEKFGPIEDPPDKL